MPSTAQSLESVPVCFGGEWHNLTSVETSPVHNPSTGEVIAQTPLCTASHVNQAVEAAAAAFPAWAETPPTDRARIFFRFKALLEEHFEDLARTNTRGCIVLERRGSIL